MILQSDHSVYRTGNVMGFIGYDHGNKKERLIINSRFSTDGNYEDFFLRYMLSKVVDPNIVELATNADTDSYPTAQGTSDWIRNEFDLRNTV